MRPDPDTCRDPELLAAEVRRLRAVIDNAPATLTYEERHVLGRVCHDASRAGHDWTARVLRDLMERMP